MPVRNLLTILLDYNYFMFKIQPVDHDFVIFHIQRLDPKANFFFFLSISVVNYLRVIAIIKSLNTVKLIFPFFKNYTTLELFRNHKGTIIILHTFYNTCKL